MSKKQTSTTEGVVGVAQPRLVVPLVLAGIEIPATVATCPECGGKLTLVSDFEIGDNDPPALECEYEPDVDSDEWDAHRWWQGEWETTIRKVTAYLIRHNAKAMASADEKTTPKETTL